jgi:hypothetical protein
MDATRGRQRLNFSLPITALLGGGRGRLVVPLAPAAALMLAALGGLMFLIMPIAVLEDLVVDSGIASFITAAQPPLGTTAHLAIAFLVALGTGGVSWFGLFLLVGNRTIVLGGNAREDGVPVLRRADAHPDAPPRRPVFANRDLGTPFLEVTADSPPPMSAADAIQYAAPVVHERAIPADLDTPLSTYRGPLDPPLPEPDPLPLGRMDEPDRDVRIDTDGSHARAVGPAARGDDPRPARTARARRGEAQGSRAARAPNARRGRPHDGIARGNARRAAPACLTRRLRGRPDQRVFALPLVR